MAKLVLRGLLGRQASIENPYPGRLQSVPSRPPQPLQLDFSAANGGMAIHVWYEGTDDSAVELHHRAAAPVGGALARGVEGMESCHLSAATESNAGSIMRPFRQTSTATQSTHVVRWGDIISPWRWVPRVLRARHLGRKAHIAWADALDGYR